VISITVSISIYDVIYGHLQAVRVQIDGLQFFYGLNVFNWKKNERLIFQRGTRSEMFKATKIGVTSYGIDVVKLISHDNKSIVAKVQALVASACKFEMLESDLVSFLITFLLCKQVA